MFDSRGLKRLFSYFWGLILITACGVAIDTNSAQLTGFKISFSAGSYSTDEDVPLTAAFTISTTPTTNIRYTTATAPENGTVTYSSADNSFTYTPNKDWFGTDRFVVTAAANTASVTATIIITVNPVDEPTVLSFGPLDGIDGDETAPLALTNENNEFTLPFSISGIDDTD